MKNTPVEIDNHLDKDGAQFAWDPTSISLAETCLRKYYYSIILGWRPQTKSHHLTFGGHYADALEQYYKLRARGSSSKSALRDVIGQTLMDTWHFKREEDGSHIPETGNAWVSGDSAKNRENLIRTIVWYVDQFEDEKITVHRFKDGTPAVEHSFRLAVDDGIVLCGHMDRLVDYGDDPFIMDQKTTGMTITPKYFEQFNPNTQMQHYTFCGRIIFSLPVMGVIIDAAQIAVGFSRFERAFIFYTQAQLDEWYDHAMYHIQAARTATLKGEFPMNRSKCGSNIDHFPMRRSSCQDYGGCEFRGVCSKSPEVRDKFLAADFIKTEPWNPLKQR